jgi:acyl-CoA thioesterase FadM
MFNEAGHKITIGTTTLVFVKKETGKPCPPPEEMINLVKEYIDE